MSLYTSLRPLLFQLPPEQAHRFAIQALRAHALLPSCRPDALLQTQVAGLNFTSPVGLSAGFDKNAECYAGALAAGFGFAEIGTVTPRPQEGNPQPRVFRLPEYQAVINRLGFNNAGLEVAVNNLRQRRAGGVVGGNIGKNKDSVDAVADYVTAMTALYPHVDYITANISSPNTPGLRAMQAGDELRALVRALHETRTNLIRANQPAKPIFVKIAPDCDQGMLEAIADVALSEQLNGLIVSNTTIARDAVAGHTHAHEAGGLSGKPLFEKSTDVLKIVYQLTQGRIPLIGVGGIASAEDAYAKIRAGASLVQLYTALVYQGIGLVPRINRGLAALLKRDGFTSVAEAVGAAA